MRPPSVVDLRASLLPHLQAPDHACHHTPTSVQLYLPQAHRVAGRGGAAAAPSASGISYGASRSRSSKSRGSQEPAAIRLLQRWPGNAATRRGLGGNAGATSSTEAPSCAKTCRGAKGYFLNRVRWFGSGGGIALVTQEPQRQGRRPSCGGRRSPLKTARARAARGDRPPRRYDRAECVSARKYGWPVH